MNHSIPLQKLEHCGIRDNALQWFKSYLNERSQYVTVNGYASGMLPITCEVPQGSVLGPVLFMIHVNDLSNASKLSRFYVFADDTSIYFDSDNLPTLLRIVNRELNEGQKIAGSKQISIKYQ